MLLDLFSTVVGVVIGYVLGFMTLILMSMSGQVSREDEKHEQSKYDQSK